MRRGRRDASTRPRERLRALRELRQRFVPRAGRADYLDRISINGVDWNIKCNLAGRRQGVALYLQRAKELRPDMSPERLQEERNRDKEQMKSRRKRRAAEGLPLRNAGASAGNKAYTAVDWEVNKICQEMCNEGDDDLAFDLYWKVMDPPSIDLKNRTFGCRDALIAAMALVLVTAYVANLGLAIVDGEGPTIGDIALFYEIGACFGGLQDGMESYVTDLLSSRYLPKMPHVFDNGRTYSYRTPLDECETSKLGAFFKSLGAYLAQKSGSILGYWGGGDGKFIDARLDSLRGITVLNLLLVMRYILGLELNGAVPVGHALYLCRDGVCLSTELIGRVFCPNLAQSENFKPHFGDYDAVVTRKFVCGVLAARERALKNPSRKLIWKGKELDVVALRAAWEAPEDSYYKTKKPRRK